MAGALRIAHVCRTGWPVTGGLPAAVHGLARALVSRGHDAWVVTLDEHDGTVLHPGVHQRVRYSRVHRVGPRRYPAGRALAEAVRGADVVHVHGLDAMADQLVWLRRVGGPPVGISTHGGYLHTPRHMRVKQVWLRTVTRWTLRHADAVWFTSAADQARLAPAGAQGTVMEDGVDLDPFLYSDRRPQAGAWLVPGRVDVHKGLDDLVDVVAALAARGRAPHRVEITGASRVPGLIAGLTRQAERRGVAQVIRFVGVLEPAAYADALARCELALLPSRREGFGIAAVEAMAAGAPVVLADIPAFRDRVRSGVDGWLARFRVPADAARLLADLPSGAGLEAVGRAARERSKRFSWRFRVRGWEAAYRALVRR